MTTERLTTSLEDKHIQYEVLHHRKDFMAQETAEDTHTPGWAFAKSVVLRAGDSHALAVVPAPARVDLEKAAGALGVSEVELADETTMGELFPDCEIGAEPPFGNLYGLPVYMDRSLSAKEHITFNGGTHDQAVRMRFVDYERVVKPTMADLTE